MLDAPAALRDRRSRTAASLVVAALAIVVTAVGHGLAGGAMPHPVALALGLVVTVLVGILVIALLLRGRASLAAAFGALGLRIRRALTPLDALRAPVTPRPVAAPAAPAAPRSALAPRPERRRGPPAFALAA